MGEARRRRAEIESGKFRGREYRDGQFLRKHHKYARSAILYNENGQVISRPKYHKNYKGEPMVSKRKKRKKRIK
jgi:hypothetical protein